jgi:hypothetical protein
MPGQHIEQGTGNVEVVEKFYFDIPCSLFDIHSVKLCVLRVSVVKPSL